MKYELGMRSYAKITSVFLLFLFLSVCIAAPLHARAASLGDLVPCTNTLNPITEGENKGGFAVEKPCSACTVFTLSQNVLNFIYWYISVPIATVMLLWAGFLMLVSGLSGSPGSYQKGKDIITRTLIGICIVFFAWLAIDTIIKVVAGRVSLTSGTPATLPKAPADRFQEGPLAEPIPSLFGPWNEVKCQEPAPIVFAPPAKQPPPPPLPPPPQGGPPPGNICLSNPVCSVDELQQVGFTEKQANAMSCIGMAESTGDPNATNPDTGACGTFQFLRSTWQDLPGLGSCASWSQCKNPGCNMAAAYLLVQRNKSSPPRSLYADWTCARCDPKGTKRACVARYDPGN